MTLSVDTNAIRDLMLAGGADADEFDLDELDISGDPQLIDATALTDALRASVVIARAPEDETATALVKSPPSNMTPTTFSQLVIRDAAQLIRMTRLANHIAEHGGSQFSHYGTMQVLADEVRAQRRY